MKPVRILIVDDHLIVRRGLRSFLKSYARWQVCGEAARGNEAVTKAKQLRPDIVLLDINMPDLDGLQAARQMLKVVPKTKILMFTMYRSEQVLREALRAGARGYVLKSDADRELLSALAAMDRNEPFFTTQVSQLILEGCLRVGSGPLEKRSRKTLTTRQEEIVRLLADGLSNKEVAGALEISVKTVEAHRTNIMRKLDLHAFSELVRYAMRQQIVRDGHQIRDEGRLLTSPLTSFPDTYLPGTVN
jgi:DNA-binding NarL/FixJ family response regulator